MSHDNDVIKTEYEEIDRDSVEMMVAIYESTDGVSDQDFRTETNTQQPLQNTGSDSVKMRSSRAVPVCLVLLCFLLLTTVIVLCVLIYTNNTNYTQERNQLLTRITNLIEEKNQLLTNITSLTKEKDQLPTNIANINEVQKWLNQDKNELLQGFNESGGRIYYQSSLYFISSAMRNWTESRRYCRERGANLIIINNRDEQIFAKNISSGIRVWIGLTDSEEEGRWKWVDGTNMTSGFWAPGEPKGGNCAVSGISGCYTYQCNDTLKWICEKKILK